MTPEGRDERVEVPEQTRGSWRDAMGALKGIGSDEPAEVTIRRLRGHSEPAPLPEGHQPMSEPDLNAIRAAAEAATPGPWRPFNTVDEFAGDLWPWGICVGSVDDTDEEEEAREWVEIVSAKEAYDAKESDRGVRKCADATYIATMDPQTTLSLIARAENAEQERDVAVALLRELFAWSGRMPDAGFSNASPRWEWWHERPHESVSAFLAGLSDKGEG